MLVCIKSAKMCKNKGSELNLPRRIENFFFFCLFFVTSIPVTKYLSVTFLICGKHYQEASEDISSPRFPSKSVSAGVHSLV